VSSIRNWTRQKEGANKKNGGFSGGGGTLIREAKVYNLRVRRETKEGRCLRGHASTELILIEDVR